MRRRILTLLLAGLAVVIAVPLGAAWSSDRKAPLGQSTFVESVVLPPQGLSVPGSEAMTLLLTGTILFGLGVAVRRSR
jgi:hypothetical protein